MRWANHTINESGNIRRLRKLWSLKFDRDLVRGFEDPS
jgi:hypothetical protein